MFDCFGPEAACDVCNNPIASCKKVHLCDNCEKAVKAACDQMKYLQRLKDAKNKM